MKASIRTLLEVTSEDGVDPEVDLDLAERDPPVYDGIVTDGRITVEVAAAAVDVELAIPNVSLLHFIATKPVNVKLFGVGDGVDLRVLMFAGANAEAVAFPAVTMLLSGTGERASVTVYYAATVV